MSKTYKWNEDKRFAGMQFAPLPPRRRVNVITLRMDCASCSAFTACTQHNRAWLCATCKAEALAAQR